MKIVQVILLMIVWGCANVYAQKLSSEEIFILEKKSKEKILDFLSYLPEIAAKSNKTQSEK